MKPTPQEIRAALQASGLTRKEMARELEYSVRALEDWLYGARNCRPAVYRQMLALSKVNESYGAKGNDMLTKTAQKYVDLMVADITANPGDFKLSVSVNPRAYALSLIDGLDDGEVSQLIEYFHYEQRALRREA